ncbi:MAG TPA: hypothetical protein VHQ94_21050 [Pyrinomonadaceae bacterium]|jgi:hypothetical protein|nr:hypothetical protein [Pyrinomonadaceae bacterium]
MTELFENFEVNRDSKVSVLLKLVAVSFVLHLALVWTVIYVPAVRDTVNIAALIASTKWVDEDYTATKIGDEVQIVQLEKFRYPDGYFALESQGFANPEVAAANAAFAPKIISQWKGFGPDPEETPSPSPEPSPSASPSASASASPQASPSAAIAQASPSPSASPLTQDEAQKQLEQIAAEGKVGLPDPNQINKKPLKDLANYANDLKSQGKLDLNQPFKVVIRATWDEKGKLKDPKLVEHTGDENLTGLFSRVVGALNDSGLLTYLSPISKDNPGSIVIITVTQGDAKVLASFEMETASPEKARENAKGLNLALWLGAGTRADKPELALIKSTTATPDGKKVVVNFSMQRQDVVEMIKKQMEPEPPPKPGV